MYPPKCQPVNDGQAPTDNSQLLNCRPTASRDVNNNRDMEDDGSYYPDDFTQVLDDEGLLKYSNPISKTPVLTVCYGFLNSELLALRMSYREEKKYWESFQDWDDDKKENYVGLFTGKYLMQPLIDGLPESVWLECVEPTLSILKALNSLKRRKSNLSMRKSSMSTVDSNASCHGDYETAPLLFNPFIHGHQMRLMRVQFLALEGVFNAQYGNNQDNFYELPTGGYQNPPVLRNNIVQRRRGFRRFNPYDRAMQYQDMHHTRNNLDNNLTGRSRTRNLRSHMAEFRGI
ncbi:uncharacterized protein LOC131956996 [Physella acuta]|uniref:uncharacterized protein LOC131956996 n=1 Tax=Physella acuta TaxID=109671 RepID=UPI0027DC67BE|nr:uncharacterized protein LOC131956996 [Physella acuta]